jgi:hypothetical protein
MEMKYEGKPLRGWPATIQKITTEIKGEMHTSTAPLQSLFNAIREHESATIAAQITISDPLISGSNPKGLNSAIKSRCHRIVFTPTLYEDVTDLKT